VERGFQRWRAVLAAVLAVAAAGALLAGAVPELRRSGYWLDEEITSLAVEGIVRDRLPTLPSGVLYERGLPYSYAAALTGRAFGYGLFSYRLTSLMLGLAAVAVTGALGRAGRGAFVGCAACWLLALFPAMAVASSWARFYSFATLAVAAGLLVFVSIGDRRSRILFVAIVGVASLVHEAATTLILLPAAGAVSDVEELRAASRRTILPAVIAIVLARLALVALNFAVPDVATWSAQPSNTTGAIVIPGSQLLRLAGAPTLIAMACVQTLVVFVCARRGRAPAYALIPAAALATLYHLGLIACWLLLATLIVRRRVRPIAWHAAASIGAGVVMWWLVLLAHRVGPTDADSWRSFILLGFTYPFDAVRYLSSRMPLTLVMLAMSAALSVAAPVTSLSTLVRLALSLVVAMLAAASIVDIGFAERYLLVIAPAIVIALAAVPALLQLALRPAAVPSSGVQAAGAVCMVLLAVLDWRVLAPPSSWLPRVEVSDDVKRLAAAGGGSLVTNDELASAYNFGRADYWYVELAEDLRKYRLQTARGARGLYAGAAIVDTTDLTQRIVACRQEGCVFAVFRTGRFPFERFEQIVDDETRALDRVDVNSDSVRVIRVGPRVPPR